MIQFTLAWRYLSVRKTRTALTTLAIALGVMLTFGLNGMLPGLQASFRQNLMATAGKVDLTVTSAVRGSFDETVVEQVRAVSGVAHASGSLVRSVVLPPTLAPGVREGQPVASLMLNGIDPSAEEQVRPLRVVSGRALQAQDKYAVLLPDSLTRRSSLSVGGTLRVPSATGSVDLAIVGVVASRTALGSEDVYVTLATAQKLLNQPGQINTIEALFAPGSSADAVSGAVLAALGSGFKLGDIQVGGEMLATIAMGGKVFYLFGVVALAMAAFVIFNTFRTDVVERRRDVGMLRALGASRRTVLGLVLIEGLWQGVLGTAIGIAAGWGLAGLLLSAMGPFWQARMGFGLGQASYPPGLYATCIVLGVGATLLAGLYPALLASRTTPLEALRPVVAAPGRRAQRLRTVVGVILAALALAGLLSGRVDWAGLGIVFLLVALVMLGPLLAQVTTAVFGGLLERVFAGEGRLARSNLMRQPGRAGITVTTMTVGLALIVAMAGYATSVISGIDSYMKTSLGADYLLMPQSLMLQGGNVGAGPQLLQALREIPGMGAVTTLRVSTTEAAGADVQAIGIDPTLYPQVAGLEFSVGDPAQAFAMLGQGRYLIANGLFAAMARLHVGQEVALQTLHGAQTYHIAAIASDFLNIKMSTIFLSQASLERDFGATSDLMVMANALPGADTAALRLALEGLVRDYPAFTLVSSEAYRQGMMQDMQPVVGVMYLLLAVLAVPSLLALANTLGISVLERTREIGVLRAVGARRRQVQRTILAESLLLSAMGIALGIVCGLWLGYVLVGSHQAFGVYGVHMPYHFPYAGVLLTIAVGLLFGVLAALLPARQAARLDILRALQYE